jgi:hypothetical protein
MKVRRKCGSLFKNYPNICLVILRKITHTRSWIGDFRAEILTRDLCVRSMTATTSTRFRPTVECGEFFFITTVPRALPSLISENTITRITDITRTTFVVNPQEHKYILQCKHVGLDILKQQTHFYGWYGQFILRWKYITGRRTAS